jgi:YHS domain-containing protein
VKARFALLFPYLCGLFVVIVIIAGHKKADTTEAGITAGSNVEICPGCAMEVDPATAPTRTTALGDLRYFCCEGCAERFESGMDGHDEEAVSGQMAYLDPVCHMEVGEKIESAYRGAPYFFCTEICRERFNEDPERYLAEVCLVCRGEGDFTPLGMNRDFDATWQGKTYRFCSAEHRDAFRDDPAGFFMHTMWGIPNWLYYTSIALVLIISFVIIELRAGKKRDGDAPAEENPVAGLPAGDEGLVRYDLLRFKWLGCLLRHDLTRFVLRSVFVVIFLLIIAAGLFGSQLPSKNIAPILTWTIWWGGLIWLVAYAGKAWCYVCPWDAISDWVEGFRFFGRKKGGMSLGLKWPRFMRNIWPATILFIGLTWIELGFGVTMIPRATAWLAIAILVLTFVSALLFDRRSFCRYGCLVGRISGLYALFAPVEVRARDKAGVCRSCSTRSCYKGNDAGEACPTFEYLGTMRQNTYCITCMECLKSCEKENVAIRLRPWGADLSVHNRPRTDEAYLALMMLSLTGFHGLTMTPAWAKIVNWIDNGLGLGDITSFSIGMVGIMFAPIVLYALLVALSRAMAGSSGVTFRDYFIRYAYALLPIALFYHLAHNSEHLLMEGQKAIALFSDPFGLEWNLFGTAQWTLQPLIDLETLWILQVFFVMVGHVYSLWTARCTAGAIFGDSRATFRSQLPMLIAMILFSIMSLWLLKQPMEMRTSAM